MSSLNNKIVVLTGAGQGLGRASAIALSDAGAIVCLLGRTLSKLQETAAQMSGEALPVAADLNDPASVRAAFAEIKNKYGRVDKLINNAAVYQPFKVEAALDEQIQGSVNTNLTGAIYCIREAIPLMREAGGGHIVNISTESVHHPIPFLTLYAASKAGLEKLTEGLKAELRPDNIRLTLLRMGAMLDPDKSRDSVFNTDLAKEFHEAFVAGGYDKMVGAGMQLSTVCGQIVNLLELPADASLDIVELRSI